MSMRPSAPRKRLIVILGCVSAGAALGVLMGASAAGRIELPAKGEHHVRPFTVSPSKAAETGGRDPLAREVGYSIASAWDVKTIARCSVLDAQFRSGCRDYVREQARNSQTGQRRYQSRSH